MNSQLNFSFPPVGLDASSSTTTSGGNGLLPWRFRPEGVAYFKHYTKAYYEDNKELILAKRRTPEFRAQRAEWRKTVSKERRRYYNRKTETEEYKAKRRLISKLTYPKRKDQMRALENLPYRKLRRRLQRQRPYQRLVNALRCRIHGALFNANKSKKTWTLIGCDFKTLVDHLKSHFQAGMTWENFGKWHIDHITPCAAFDLRCPVQQSYCFRWDNLQPLWARDNIVKRDKLIL